MNLALSHNKRFRLISMKQLRRSPHRRKSTKQPTTVLLAFNKPFNTLCQFSGEPGDSLLSDFIDIKEVYPAGRLDKDSEGLLLLTNDGALQHKISHPRHKQDKTYWVQVEGSITNEAIEQLAEGIELKDGLTRPAKAQRLNPDNEKLQLWERKPPIRARKNITTSWLILTLKEGKNRQVRRMTAAVGFPTLRLIRVKIGAWELNQLKPGEFTRLDLIE